MTCDKFKNMKQKKNILKSKTKQGGTQIKKTRQQMRQPDGEIKSTCITRAAFNNAFRVTPEMKQNAQDESTVLGRTTRSTNQRGIRNQSTNNTKICIDLSHSSRHQDHVDEKLDSSTQQNAEKPSRQRASSRNRVSMFDLSGALGSLLQNPMAQQEVVGQLYTSGRQNQENGHTENKLNNTLGHLKRRARDRQNSKQDEFSYFIGSSGNRNKFRKNDEPDLNIQSSCQSKRAFTRMDSGCGKIQDNLLQQERTVHQAHKKRISKHMKNQSDRDIIMNEASVFSQIRQINISKDDLGSLKNPSDESDERMKETYEQQPQLQKSNYAAKDKITHNQDSKSLFDMQNLGQTQKDLIKLQQLNPHLYKKGPTKYQTQKVTAGENVKRKGHWTEDEDKILTQSVDENHGKNWKRIAESLPGRTDVQCLHRWKKVLNPSLVKGPWTDIEDRLLLYLVSIDGPQRWTSVADHLPGRIGKQCRERWHNHLDPMIKRQAWSVEEEWILFLLNRTLENKWADIAKFLEGRTDNTIKNHWNTTMKKRIEELKASFEHFFRNHLTNKGFKYMGCETFEQNENGEPKDKSKLPKGYTKDYIKVMREFEENLFDEKLQSVKSENKIYYKTKYQALTEDKKDIFKQVKASIMLNSGSECIDQNIKPSVFFLSMGSKKMQHVDINNIINTPQTSKQDEQQCQTMFKSQSVNEKHLVSTPQLASFSTPNSNPGKPFSRCGKTLEYSASDKYDQCQSDESHKFIIQSFDSYQKNLRNSQSKLQLFQGASLDKQSEQDVSRASAPQSFAELCGQTKLPGRLQLVNQNSSTQPLVDPSITRSSCFENYLDPMTVKLNLNYPEESSVEDKIVALSKTDSSDDE